MGIVSNWQEALPPSSRARLAANIAAIRVRTGRAERLLTLSRWHRKCSKPSRYRMKGEQIRENVEIGFCCRFAPATNPFRHAAQSSVPFVLAGMVALCPYNGPDNTPNNAPRKPVRGGLSQLSVKPGIPRILSADDLWLVLCFFNHKSCWGRRPPYYLQSVMAHCPL